MENVKYAPTSKPDRASDVTKQKAYFAREATGLVRQLNGWDVMFGSWLALGPTLIFTFSFFELSLYPGADLRPSVLVGAFVFTVTGALIYLMTVAMPRTGADYVWTSRIIHPVLGFVTNFTFVIFFFALGAGLLIWIPVYGIAPMLSALGIIWSNPGLISLATTVASPPTSYLIAFVAVLGVLLPPFFGTKVVFRSMWVYVPITLIGTFAMIFAFLSAPNATFVANFNRLSGMNYAATIKAGALPLGFNNTSTLLGSVFTIAALIGFNFSAYYTGEVKNVRKNQLMGIMGSLYLALAVYAAVFIALYYSVGADFFNAVSTLAATGNSFYKLPSPPVMNFLVAFATPNPLIIILTTVGYIAGIIPAVLLANFYTQTRNMFAWSFDGIMPSALSKMGTRYNSPYIAVGVGAVAYAICGILYYSWPPMSLYLTYGLTGQMFPYVVVGLVGVLFPFVRKDLFKASPEITKKRIGRVPWVCILGAIAVVCNVGLIYALVLPAVTPPPSGPPIVQLSAYAAVPLVGLAGLIIYIVMFYYRKSQGIDLTYTFKEVPPE